ncbi:glycosyltransferase [Desulfosoma sp.]
MNNLVNRMPGTIVWIGPFYNRSGYGIGARTIVTHLHRMGNRVRVVSVDEVEPGIDDCDLELINRLEKTPVVPPVTAVISHVATVQCLDVKLPEPNLRIIATTVFDCAVPDGPVPTNLLNVCRQMDQVWLHTPGERERFIEVGFSPDHVYTLLWPHHWLENPTIPAAEPEPERADKPFRFLNISMFLPRRRWDTLIEAFLEEFKGTQDVELYLKVNYPSWHPKPGKPRRDLFDLIASLQKKTSSEAPIIIDEDLDTRLGILRLIDSCNTYISTDTAPTAPVSESTARQRMVILPAGLLNWAPNTVLEIPVDPHARKPITQDILEYQPHHSGLFMPVLHVKDVRRSLRQAYEMPLEERRARAAAAAASLPNPKDCVHRMLEAMHQGWKKKSKLEARKPRETNNFSIVWEGSQLVRHSLALINREISLRLMDKGYDVTLIPFEPDEIDPASDPRLLRIQERTSRTIPEKVDLYVRHRWPPDWNPPPKGRWVTIQPWEFGSLPVSWIGPLNALVDEIWVPSSYVRECYIASGIAPDRVIVVPNGVDTRTFHPEAPPTPLKTQKRFKFLFVGGTIFRKGIDILLKAYAEAFSNKDDVCLVIKDMGMDTFYRGQTAREMIEAICSASGSPEIEYIQQMLNESEMASLYTACHCLVHPYRGEGFALPVAEAMACELPVVVTGYGAVLDYCSEENAYLLPYQLRRFPEKRLDDMETVDYPWLAEPDHTALKTFMRHIYENPQEAKGKGRAGRQRIEQDLTWDNTMTIVESRIRHLAKRPIRRVQVSLGMPVQPKRESASPGGSRPRDVELAGQSIDTGLCDPIHHEDSSTGSGLFQTCQSPPHGNFKGSDQTLPQQFKGPKGILSHGDSPFLDDDALTASRTNAGQKMAVIFNEEGERRFANGNLEDAKICFEMAVAHDPLCALAYNNLGVFYWQTGQLEKSAECLYRAFELNPRHPDILRNSARILATLGEMAVALEVLRLYLAICPNDMDTWSLYDEWVRQGCLPQWKPEGLPLSLADTYARMGKEFAARQDFIGALEAFLKALKLDSSRADIKDEMDRVLAALESAEQASPETQHMTS